MELDPIESLLALGMISPGEIAASKRVPGADSGRFGKLALVGVDVAALLPTVAAIARMQVAPRELIAAPGPPPNTPPPWPTTVQHALLQLPACPLLRAPTLQGQIDVVLSDPQTRTRVAELLGPAFRPWLATESDVRALAARHMPEATAAVVADAAAVASATAATRTAKSLSALAELEQKEPTFATNEHTKLVEAARPKTTRTLEGTALAAALAEQIDLTDDEKRHILDLDDKIERLKPHELLGVAPNAPADDVKERYYELSKRFHPDVHFRKKLGSFKVRVPRIFKALKKACDHLVAEAERRDHLDLGPPSGSSFPTRAASEQRMKIEMRPDKPVSAPGASAAAKEEVSTKTRLRQAMQEFELEDASGELELDQSRQGVSNFSLGGIGKNAGNATGALRPDGQGPLPALPQRAGDLPEGEPDAAATPAPALSPRPQMPTLSAPQQRRSMAILAAIASVLLVVVVVAVIVAIGRAAPTDPEVVQVDPLAQQVKLFDSAKRAQAAGNFADAIVFATGAINAAPTSPLVPQLRVLRGRAYLENGDRAQGFTELELALKQLPVNDPARADVQAALAKAKAITIHNDGGPDGHDDGEAKQ